MKFVFAIFSFFLISSASFAQEIPACEENCEITWERSVLFPAIAASFDYNVYERATDVFVKSINGVGTIRELVLFMRNGQQRVLTDTYNKLMSPSGTGILVKLGNPKDVQFIRIKADSWGGAGTEVEILVQLRERYQK